MLWWRFSTSRQTFMSLPANNLPRSLKSVAVGVHVDCRDARCASNVVNFCVPWCSCYNSFSRLTHFESFPSLRIWMLPPSFSLCFMKSEMLHPCRIAYHCGFHELFASYLNCWGCGRTTSKHIFFAVSPDILVPSVPTFCDISFRHRHRRVKFWWTTQIQQMHPEIMVGFPKSVPALVLRWHPSLMSWVAPLRSSSWTFFWTLSTSAPCSDILQSLCAIIINIFISRR
jgi:hypothetical protein